MDMLVPEHVRKLAAEENLLVDQLVLEDFRRIAAMSKEERVQFRQAYREDFGSDLSSSTECVEPLQETVPRGCIRSAGRHCRCAVQRHHYFADRLAIARLRLFKKGEG